MKKSIFKGKSTRTKIFTVITAAGILLLLILNLVLTYFGSERMLFADMTPEGFYTVTDNMIDACHSILDNIDMTWYTKTNSCSGVEQQLDEGAAHSTQAELPSAYSKRGQDESDRRVFQRFLDWNPYWGFWRELFFTVTEYYLIRLYRLFSSTGIVDRIQQFLWYRLQIAEVRIS